METKRTGLVKPSTKAWLDETRKLKGYSFFDWIHGYIYSRYPYFYISVGTGQHPLSKALGPVATKLISFFARKQGKQEEGQPEQDAGKMFANTYHGKVVPLEAAKQLVMVREEISAALPESVIPYDRARDLIMKNPQNIVALDCPCRVARKNPCLPLDVCLIIGDPFASFIAEHQPTRSRQITSDEAVDILKAEDERGHVHHAFFKDAMLGRFYAICNCCDCCCGAMHAHRTGTPMLASSGFVAQVDPDLCLACGTCETSCQFHAITVDGEKNEFAVMARVDEQKCMGCGVCTSHCPQEAITLRKDSSRGEPLEIFKLMEEAAQA